MSKAEGVRALRENRAAKIAKAAKPRKAPVAEKPAREMAPAKPARKLSAASRRAQSATRADRARKQAPAASASDRSPLAVGNAIVAGGEKGIAMLDLVKRFGVEAHPMRSKIHDAKHKLGFTIEYDAVEKRYVGSAPKAK